MKSDELDRRIGLVIVPSSLVVAGSDRIKTTVSFPIWTYKAAKAMGISPSKAIQDFIIERYSERQGDLASKDELLKNIAKYQKLLQARINDYNILSQKYNELALRIHKLEEPEYYGVKTE